MEARKFEVPIWPPNVGGSPRRMLLISCEPRWYLWMREENQQGIASVRRDLLLLHQNGDLELLGGNTLPSNGTYVTALHEGRMIRGRVCPSQMILESQKEKHKLVSVIDVDEGKIVQLPQNQLRLLPQEMMILACQAVRCDIGMDCIEQFEWPSQINSMLHKALGNAMLFVENMSNRPGSIPTISGKITLCNPSTGDSISIQRFLLEIFSVHLSLCSLEKFKPFPLGMVCNVMPQNLGLFQQPRFGMNIQGLPANTLPVSYHTPVMPLLAPPNVPSNNPQYFSNFPRGLPPNQNFSYRAGFMPPPPPNVIRTNYGLSPHPFTPPFSAGTSISGSSSLANLETPQPSPSQPLSATNSNRALAEALADARCLPPLTSSLSSSLASLAISEYDSAETSPSTSTVGIELHNSTSRSSSSEEQNSKVKEAVNLPRQSKQMNKTEKILERGVSFKDTEANQSADSLEIDMKLLSSPCRKEGNRKEEIESSSSSLSAEAPPFVPKSKSANSKKKNIIQGSEDHIGRNKIRREIRPQPVSPPIEKSVVLPSKNNPVTSQKNFKIQSDEHLKSNSRILSQPSSAPKKKSVVLPTENSNVTSQKNVQISPDPQQPSCSSSHTYPIGPDVELPQIVRKWKIGHVVPALIARVWNPSCFEVNVVDEMCELVERILEEMNDYYKSHKINMSSKQQAAQLCGHFCACFDVDEGIWFRAEIDEWFMEDSVIPLKVWAVDYGGFSRVDLGSIQPLSTQLACQSPRMVTICSMRNVEPRSENEIWPQVHLDRVKQLLPEDTEMYLRIDGNHSKEFIWPVSVFTDSKCSLQSINEVLVSEGCASYVGSAPSKARKPSEDEQLYEDADDPMEEAYKIGGNNYEVDDEDACVAVSGWKSKEEEGICWFYHREGYCYKNYCELRHVRLNPDGQTIEKREMHTCSFEDIQDLLCPGKTIKLVVTRILTVNHFMASIKFEKGSIKSRETLASVLKHLNTTEMKRSLKTFTEYPADGEIVLFRDSKSKMFFRGRIITSSPNNDDLYQVLNVDNGFMRAIPLGDLRRVDPAFLHHPFQAVECWLADVAPTQTDREWTKSCNAVFSEMVRDTSLLATIIRSSPWGIEVNLLDKDGNDLSLVLKEMQILKSCPMRHLPLPGSHQIPG